MEVSGSLGAGLGSFGERADFEQHDGSHIGKFPSLCIILLKHDVLLTDDLFVCRTLESNEDLQAAAADGVGCVSEPKTPHA